MGFESEEGRGYGSGKHHRWLRVSEDLEQKIHILHSIIRSEVGLEWEWPVKLKGSWGGLPCIVITMKEQRPGLPPCGGGVDEGVHFKRKP